MFKKIKTVLFSILILTTLAGCNNVEYSFSNVTGYEITEINKVMYDYCFMQSWRGDFLGDFAKFLDTKYVKVESDSALTEYTKAHENYNFGFFIEYKENKYEEIGPTGFYVYSNRIYTLGNDDNLYRSKNYVSLLDLRCEAEGVEPHSEIISSNYTRRLSMTVNYDYGLHVEDKAILLLDGILPFFDLGEFGIDNLVAGDELEIRYNGEFLVRETYPATLDKSSCEIVSVEVTEADIYEFKILSIPGSGQLDIIPLNQNIYNIRFETEYVINEDGTYQSYKELPEETKIYGSISKSRSNFNMMALYSYNPRGDKEVHDTYVKFYQEPTCLDEGCYIEGCYCHEGDVYIPIDKVNCSYDENGICIWCKSEKSTTHYVRVENVRIESNYLINSKEEFTALLDECGSHLLNYEYDQEIIDAFDEEYFNSKSLIVISKIEGSGSISHEVKKVTINNGFVDVVIERNVPICGTCDMAYWLIIIETDEKIPSDYDVNVTYNLNNILNYPS